MEGKCVPAAAIIIYTRIFIGGLIRYRVRLLCIRRNKMKFIQIIISLFHLKRERNFKL